MKTQKMNLHQRLQKASKEIDWYQKELCMDLLNYGEKSASVEWDLCRLKYWTKYVKNTCEMHGLTFNVLLL